MLGRRAKVIQPRIGMKKLEEQVGLKEMTFEDDFLPDEDEEEKVELGEEDEIELELVYIDALGCYYCPGDQKYYQVDEDK
jgi:hypothetical protein